MRDKHCWIQTYTGIRFLPNDPRPEDIRIEDIAHALSCIARFNGHTERFYSVAQHSVLVSETLSVEASKVLAPPGLEGVMEESVRNLSIAGLMHDAAEAYIGDITRPVKSCVPCFREMEERITSCIREALDVPQMPEHILKGADNRLLATEARDLLRGGAIAGWADAVSTAPLDRVIAPLSPEMAEAAFLARWEELRSASCEF